MSQIEKREWMYIKNKHIAFSYFSFSSLSINFQSCQSCFSFCPYELMTLLKSSTCCLNVGSVKMNWWPIRVVAFKWNICLQIEFLCLYPRSRVSGWGQSFVPPPPFPTYRGHCWSHVDAELCVILPCYFSVKGRRNLFPTFFPLPCPYVLLFGLLVPHRYNVMGWKFLCSQCGESILDKPVLYTSHVILFITIKLKPAMVFSKAIFTHLASVS